MKPPECAVCGVSIDGEPRRQVRFVHEESTSAPGGERHVEWFCDEHLEGARALQGCRRDDAIARLREPLPRSARQPPAYPFPIALGLGGFCSALARILSGWIHEELGKDVGPTKSETRTTYHPMDGSVPPYCPYVVEILSRAAGEHASWSIRYTEAYWNETERSSTGFAAFVEVEGVDDIGIFSEGERGGTIQSSAPLPIVASLLGRLESIGATTEA